MRQVKRLGFATAGAILLVALLAVATARAADEVPLKATVVTTSSVFVPGTFPVIGTVTSTGVGQGTHLGKFTTSGSSTLTWTGTGVWFEGTATTVAANGDELHVLTYGWTTGPDELEAEFTITGGTGRFQDATGSGTVTATTDEDGVQTAYYEGTIDYKQN